MDVNQPKKDVLLTKDGTIGRAAVVKDENDFVALSSLGIITPDERKLDSDYLRFFLISGINVEQMFSLIAGAALTRLTIEKMKHLVITIPPINEQREIISRLEIKVVGFDNSIEKISIQIEKLKEYRQTIISEAVTGKIDLRQWQPKKQQVS
jgi:type I restriction enzyme S subunit